MPSWFSWITVLGSYIYTVLAVKVFYGSRWFSVWSKTLLAMFIYLIFGLIVLILGFIVNLYFDSLISGANFVELISH